MLRGRNGDGGGAADGGGVECHQTAERDVPRMPEAAAAVWRLASYMYV